MRTIRLLHENKKTFLEWQQKENGLWYGKTDIFTDDEIKERLKLFISRGAKLL